MRQSDLQNYRTRDLLRLYADILTELIRRGVTRSRNPPAGDLAEHLVAQAYRGILADRSVKSWDVRTPDGKLLQVKSRVLVRGDRSAHFFSPFRSWNFDTVVFVIFDAETYDITRAVELPTRAVREISRYAEWVKGSQVRTNRPLLQLHGARDVTAQVRDAFDSLDLAGQSDVP